MPDKSLYIGDEVVVTTRGFETATSTKRKIEMNKEQIAYLAGLIDADGTIAVTHNGSNTSKYIPYVTISNTNRKMLEWCKELIGKGTICTHKAYKPNHSLSYSIRWEFNTAINIALLCLPYLIVKRKRAKLLLKWKSVTKRNGKYTDKEWQRKMGLINEMYRLSKVKEN